MDAARAAAGSAAETAGRACADTLRKTRDGFASLRGSPREVRPFLSSRNAHAPLLYPRRVALRIPNAAGRGMRVGPAGGGGVRPAARPARALRRATLRWPLVPRAACAAPDAPDARPRRQLWLIYLMKVLESFGYFSLSAILTARARFLARFCLSP